jgi:hypothetical protein
MNVLDQPRYKEAPIKLFFENYILFTLRLLPEEISDNIQKLNLKKVFNVQSENWYDAIPEAMKFGKTMEVAIWDNWIDNKDIFIKENRDIKEFAMNFADEYFKEESTIDHWTEESYKNAARRVNEFIKELSKR